jgi:hypothetical protein
MLALLSFYLESLKDSSTSALLQSLLMHTLVLSLLSFYKPLRPLRDFVFLPSPTDGEYNAFLASCSSNLLLSLSGCSATQ